MKRDEIPMMRDVLNRAIQIDAMIRASLWATARLSYGLRKKNVLSDSEIEELFDPAQLDATIPKELRAVAFEAIRALRDQSLGKRPRSH
jgi:hypothetical protein